MKKNKKESLLTKTIVEEKSTPQIEIPAKIVSENQVEVESLTLKLEEKINELKDLSVLNHNYILNIYNKLNQPSLIKKFIYFLKNVRKK